MKALCAAVALVFAATDARAAAIADVAPWVTKFQAAALANDPGAMLADAKEVVIPGFPADSLRGIFDKIDAVVGTEPGDHAEQFDEKNVGTFLKRINIAVHYPKSYLFYSLTFVRGSSGWQLGQIDYNTDVNEVFSLKWPD